MLFRLNYIGFRCFHFVNNQRLKGLVCMGDVFSFSASRSDIECIELFFGAGCGSSEMCALFLAIIIYDSLSWCV